MHLIHVINVSFRINMDSLVLVCCIFIQLIKGGVMALKDTETLSTGIEFIVEAVAVKTNGQDHSALGLYLISLLLEDQKIDLDCDDKRKRVGILFDKSRTTRLDLGWKSPTF